jgi:phage tail protein X
MASRYENNPVKTTNDGRRVYRSKIYPNIPLRDDDVYVASETGDRLDTLAYQYYQDASLWWIIAAANGLGKGTLLVPGGVKLRIPNIINIQSYINEINLSR